MGELPGICLTLLSALETGASAHSAVQADADRLQAQCAELLCTLLAADCALAADAGVQTALLRHLGSMQDMLNDARRRKLFCGLPFAVLRVSVHRARATSCLMHCYKPLRFQLFICASSHQLGRCSNWDVAGLHF